jgi:LacI family transcriptional regulator
VSTIKDVAKRANVSVGTVSAALNKTKYVSPALMERVLQAVDELDYRADGIARSLKRGKTDLIGLIVDDLNNLFYVELLEQIEYEARKNGYSVLLCQSGGDVATERAYLDILKKYRVDGLIWSTAGKPEHYEAEYGGKFPVPLVLVDRVQPSFAGFDHVVLNNNAAGRQAVDYLLDLGHRQIVLLNGPDYLSVAHERRLGFEEGLIARNVEIDDRLVINASFHEQEAFEACCDLLLQRPDVTAIMAASGVLFVSALRALKACKRAFPDDVSIVGIDDFPLASLMTPSVTVVAQPVKRIGKVAFELLLRRMETPDAPTMHRTLEPSLIVRSSCRPVGESAKTGEKSVKRR